MEQQGSNTSVEKKDKKVDESIAEEGMLVSATVEQIATTSACVDWKMNRKPSAWAEFLNLFMTVMCVSNYYVQIPTGPDYTERVGAPKSMSGVMLGLAPLVGIPSLFIWSFVYRHVGFRRAFVIINTVALISNLLYALSETSLSSAQFYISRALVGVAYTLSLSVNWISQSYGSSLVKTASGKLGTAVAGGVAGGAIIAALLSLGDAKVGKVYFDKMTLPGWFYAAMSIFFMVAFWFLFEEPQSRPECDDGCPECANEDAEKKGNAQSTPVSIAARRRTTWTVISLLIMNGCGRFSLGGFEAAAPFIADYFFGWSVTVVSVFLGAIGLAVFPAFYIQQRYLSHISEKKMAVALIFTNLAANIVLLQYGSPFSECQYIIGGSILFITLSLLFGIIQSLFIKIIPKDFGRRLKVDVGILSLGSMAVGRALGTALGSQFPDHPQHENIIMGTCLGVMFIHLILLLVCYTGLTDPNIIKPKSKS
eukprot:Nk52_evm33s2325 gene=Nk52_evmTU33s2325